MKSGRLKLLRGAIPRTASLAFLSVFTPAALGQNPVPFINQPLIPDAAAPGGPGFTLTVSGTGFISGSMVRWNGGALATQFVRGSQLTATVPAADIAAAGTALVTVVSPGAGAGASSNVASFPIATPATGIAFASSDVFIGNAPLSLIAVDLNGDGKLDLAVTSPGTVSILLGNGDGTFQPHLDYTVGSSPDSVAYGDFNGDGKLDLAVGDSSDGSVRVLIGNGDGSFQGPLTYETGEANLQLTSLAAADFNGDGKLDLVMGDFGSGTGGIFTFLGNGDGTFQAPVAASDYPAYTIAVGDLNGDGKLDLFALGGPNFPPELSFLAGNGDGTFQSPQVLAELAMGLPAPTQSSLPVADWGGGGGLGAVALLNLEHGGTDGAPPVTLAFCSSCGETVIAGGGFASSASAVSGDFNADGKLDVLIDTDRSLSFLAGNGDGTFQTLSSGLAGGTVLTAGDFNGDGKLDLAVANSTGNTVSILLQVPPLAILDSLSSGEKCLLNIQRRMQTV